MSKVTSVYASNTTQKPKTLAQVKKRHTKLEIGQILKGDTNGYKKHVVQEPVAPVQTITQQETTAPKAEPKSAPVVAQTEVATPATKSAEQTRPAKSTSISKRRYYERKIGIYQDTKPKNLAQLRKQRERLDVGQTLKNNTNGYDRNRFTQLKTNPAPVMQGNQQITNIPLTSQAQTTLPALKTQWTQQVASMPLASQTKMPLPPLKTLLNQPMANIPLTSQAQTTLPALKTQWTQQIAGMPLASQTKMTLPPLKTLLNQPIANIPLTSQAQTTLPALKTQWTQQIAGMPLTSQAKITPPALEIQSSQLTPIQPGKGVFNPKFWGTPDMATLKPENIRPAGVNIGTQSHQLTPIQPGKGVFNPKFWGTPDMATLKPENIRPAGVNIGTQSHQLTPIQPGKGVFNPKFWGTPDEAALKGKLKYAPELSTSGKTVLGNAGTNAGKRTVTKFFSGQNIKNVLKSKGGKFGVAAGVAALAVGGAAVAYNASQNKGYEITSINSYREQLQNYEKAHGGMKTFI